MHIYSIIYLVADIFAQTKLTLLSAAISFLLKNRSLRYPLFRNFLTLRFFMILALDMQITIIYWWVYHLTNDVSLVGVLGLCEAIPAIGCSFFSGHFVDHQEKKKILLTCTIGYLLISGLFITLSSAYFGHVSTVAWIVRFVYMAVFLGGVLRAFLSPASFAIMGMLVPRKEYPNATTWSSTAWQIGAVIGPLLGGFLLSYGVNFSLIFVAVLQVIALIALTRIPAQQIIQKEREPILKSLREGLRFVFSTQVILAALSLDMFAVLFGGAVALLPAIAKDVLHVGVIGFGWLRAAPGLGAIITLGILSFIPLKKKPGYKLLACVSGFGIVTIIFGISTSFMLSFAMLLLAGMFDAVSVVIRSTILQIYTPDNVRGRVAAVNTMFVSSSNELGAVESGYTAKWMGTVPSIIFGGCMTLVVVGASFFLAPKLKRLDFSTVPDKDYKK